MGSPYLNNNESIILSTHNVVINTIPAEAILTNQRLILVDARHTQLRPQDVPFVAIETVTIGDNSAMDPVLSISIVTPDETRHQLGMTFTQLAKYLRDLGCEQAMNLDGGGSATLWAFGAVKNSPSEGQERAAPNALVVVKPNSNPATAKK